MTTALPDRLTHVMRVASARIVDLERKAHAYEALVTSFEAKCRAYRRQVRELRYVVLFLLAGLAGCALFLSIAG
jgi:hypothetical protein